VKGTIATPCIDVCLIDEQVGWCVGCGRTRGEIARWSALSPQEREAIMAGLGARLEAMRAQRASSSGPPDRSGPS
jgi:hypothetical protein